MSHQMPVQLRQCENGSVRPTNSGFVHAFLILIYTAFTELELVGPRPRLLIGLVGRA